MSTVRLKSPIKGFATGTQATVVDWSAIKTHRMNLARLRFANGVELLINDTHYEAVPELISGVEGNVIIAEFRRVASKEDDNDY